MCPVFFGTVPYIMISHNLAAKEGDGGVGVGGCNEVIAPLPLPRKKLKKLAQKNIRSISLFQQ